MQCDNHYNKSVLLPKAGEKVRVISEKASGRTCCLGLVLMDEDRMKQIVQEERCMSLHQ